MTRNRPGRSAVDERLLDVLGEARERGFLGPGELVPHVEHARGFAVASGAVPTRFLDLGAGGGVPGLVLALLWPAARGVLLESGERRADFLETAVGRLELEDRITVVCVRAEEGARRSELRAQFDLVTARSFGPPPVTAECSVGFLETGGAVVVSEPPGGDVSRWPDEGLAALGLALEASETSPYGFVRLRLNGRVADRWPRRTGIPAKRPVWD